MKSYFVPPKGDPEKLISWKRVDCEIKDMSGDVIFSMKNVEAPESWSQLAIEIAASKYFRKVGVPKKISAIGGETSVRQMVRRVVDAIARAGLEQKIFRTKKQADLFGKELKFILLTQKASFNSPVWFNCGLFQSYGIETDSEHFYFDIKKKKVMPVTGVYKRPQVSACFIQKVGDDLEDIYDLLKSEAKLFKFGSGSGTNFSSLRSKYELLSGGGTSSGLISFLEIFDKGAGAIKSGGTTRRAAKMVCLDVDHPEIMEFIDWKAKEEKKAQALIREGFDSHYEGEAYRTVSGQNSNNSVRISDAFLKALESNGVWSLKSRTTGEAVKKISADQVWNRIVSSAWICADPGLQFHDTIQKWHTCPSSGPIRASNPCSEYMFLDDSACNLASLNLLAFLNQNGEFDWEAYQWTSRVMFIAQEILVDFASYPTAQIAQNSHDYRPLGLGFAGLGALLMRKGISYDSEEARSWAGALTAMLHGSAYDQSAELAKLKGAFRGFKKNKTAMIKVLEMHRSSLDQINWKFFSETVSTEIRGIFSTMIKKAKAKGLRNAQATVMAPTGTIGLVMDCDTTGVEPEFSLVKFKKLSGGGKVTIVSQSVEPALKKLGYAEGIRNQILQFVIKTGTIEGAPGLKEEDLPIFDCAHKNGEMGKRYLNAQAHLKMMAAIQPFLSGAISKTVNLPADATAATIADIYKQAWRMGLKAIAIYRDGSKLSQPLNAKLDSPACPECGGKTEVAGGCFRCTNCGYTTGCVS